MTGTPGLSEGLDIYLVIWTLLINIVIVWTPLVVFLTKKMGRLEEIGKITDHYGLDKIAERVNTVEQLAYRLKESTTGMPARITALEEIGKNIRSQVADHPARVTAIEVRLNGLVNQIGDYPSRVTALEVLTDRMQSDVSGVPARVIAVEVISKRLQEELLIIPAKVIAIELFQDNMQTTQAKLTEKLDKLEAEHLQKMGHCRSQSKQQG